MFHSFLTGFPFKQLKLAVSLIYKVNISRLRGWMLLQSVSSLASFLLHTIKDYRTTGIGNVTEIAVVTSYPFVVIRYPPPNSREQTAGGQPS